MSKRKRSVRRVTAPQKEALARLANILCDFLPLKTYSTKATNFRSIFAASRIQRYLDGPKIKRKALEQGLTRLYRYHERLPFTIIRKIISASIDYRYSQRRPLTRKELEALAATLFELGIDMRQEIASIRLDEGLPVITVAPEKLKERLREHNLHVALASEPLTLFEDGHFNESVRKATERFEGQLRALSGRDTYGTKLMGQAFGDGALLNLENLKPENKNDFVRGYQSLAIGMMSALRNVFSHGDELRRSPEECFEMLLFVNWMFRALKNPDVDGAP